MQDVWRCGAQWDESVTQAIQTEWLEFVQQLDLLKQVSFNRRLFADGHQGVQIHGFCDASNNGYGACVYARSYDSRGNVTCRLICAKSRVAPLKTTTIPRLELCGALILSRLYHETIEVLGINPEKSVFWCDSTIVLSWLRTSPHLLKTYVANRVTVIQGITGDHEWRHVKSEDNPADAISRGQMPQAFVRNTTWFTGPQWLTRDTTEWPIGWPSEEIQSVEVPELKKVTCLATMVGNPEIFERFSSFARLRRVVAYCLRFRPSNTASGPLSVGEIIVAETRILKLLQTIQLSDELERLKTSPVPAKGRFANLNPFLDEEGIIRVGGRLKGSNLPFARKHPILLPSRHRLTDQIIREIHIKYHHPGIQTTLCILRQKYWVLDGRNQVRKVIRGCTRCFRFNATEIEYKMGNLPSARVSEATPFTHTGIDFCGPFHIKENKHRNRMRIKVYVCVFICMSIKAVHLEVVSDLTTDGFLAALRRFAARRGLPSHIYSDNGTNFVGANNQLNELYALFNSNGHKNQIQGYASENRIQWHFMPPAAPHFGGLWESTVKLFKHHFRRVVGDSLFTFEELNTFTIEIEGVLNSRPLTSISSDPNDALVLTPAHFLVGKPLTTLPEGNLTCVSANRVSTWQHITKVREDFWARWNLEYLNELQKRHKWVKDGPELKVGAIVLVKEKNQPCLQWMLGRVIQLHPGDDGISRAATIKTANGELKRTTKILCPLPID